MTDSFAALDLMEAEAMPPLGMRETLGYYRRAVTLAAQLALGRRTVRSQKLVQESYEASAQSRPPEWNSLHRPMVLFRDGKRLNLSLLAFHREWVRVLAETVRRIKAKTVLDVGCGEGINLALLSRLYPEMFRGETWLGFDYSPARSARAKALLRDHLQLPNVDIWHGDAKGIALRPDSIDLVCCFHVLLGEPFYAYKTLAGKLHSRYHDYFRASVKEVCSVGFRLVDIAPLRLQDPFNQTTLVMLEAAPPAATRPSPAARSR